MASTSALLLCLFVVLTFVSLPINVVHGCGINIVNGCPYTVTTCAQSANNPISQYNLGSGASQFLNFGSACSWPAGAIWASVGGQCAVSGTPNAAKDRNLADLAEFTIGGSGGQDTYDISNVNAYTIGLSIAVTSSVNGGVLDRPEKVSTPRCATITCAISNIRSFCQGNNRLDSLPSGAVSCINTDGTNGIGPTSNTNLFKSACPTSYSYNYDDVAGTFNCGTGSNYQVTFCPGGITSVVNQSRSDLGQ